MATDFVDYVDMNLNDDTLKAWDGERTPAPNPGTYIFAITKAAKEQSKKGNPQLTIDFEVVSAVDGGDTPEKGKTLRGWYSLRTDVDASRRRMKNLIMASQCPLDERGGFSVQSLEGCVLQATVRQEEYEDLDASTGQPVRRTSNRLSGEKPVANAEPEPAPAPRAPAPRTVGRSVAPRR